MVKKIKLPIPIPQLLIISVIFIVILVTLFIINQLTKSNQSLLSKATHLNNNNSQLLSKLKNVELLYSSVSGELADLKNDDQFLINKSLEEEIKNINKNYKNTFSFY